MFGYVSANIKELSKAQKQRYTQAYCGLCRALRQDAPGAARLALSYDMAFLALLLMSLYEPQEQTGKKACALHPIDPRPWTDNAYIRYAADMNLALAYYKADDDVADEGSFGAKWKRQVFASRMDAIRSRYPRQCSQMEKTLAELSRLEKENCPDADVMASCFGRLMAELFVYEEDLWSHSLRQLGMALGRYIYFADAAVDYRRDRRKGSYNPFLAMGTGERPQLWEQYLVLAMGRCTDYYERLPLVQDKALLDNILYSGIWLEYRARMGREKGGKAVDGRSV